MIEDIEIEMELRGRECLVTAQAEWHWEKCECSSECGNEWVTEKWDEVEIDDLVVLTIDVLTDSNEYKGIPVNSLSSSDMDCIHELAGEYIIKYN